MAIAGIGTLLQLIAVTEEGRHRVAEAEENALLAEVASADARERGARRAGLLRIKRTQLGGAQAVAYARSGVDSSTGTPAAVQADTAAIGELDALTAENDAAREAWGLGKQAEKFKKQASRERTRTAFAQVGAILGGYGDFVGSK